MEMQNVTRTEWTFIKKTSLYPLFIAIVLVSSKSIAADSTTTSPTTWNAFIDAYYTRNFNDPSTRQNQLRNFDIYENQITLSLVDLAVQRQAQPVGFKVELGFGTTSDWVNTAKSTFGTVSPSLANVMQAYGTVIVPVGSGLEIDIGKFVTHMGNEVIVSQSNWNYSRSYLFAFAIPYYHTGIRLMYPFVSNFTVALHIVNGWNSVIDNNKFMSLGATLNYSPTSTTNLVFNGMWGQEGIVPGENGDRDVYDFILAQQLSDAFQVAINTDYGQAGTTAGLALWKGLALYQRYALSSKFAMALREEVYYDPSFGGYTTGAGFAKATFQEYTLTYELHPYDPLLIRIEGRDDFANGDSFLSASSVAPYFFPTKKSQPTLTVSVVTSF